MFELTQVRTCRAIVSSSVAPPPIRFLAKKRGSSILTKAHARNDMKFLVRARPLKKNLKIFYLCHQKMKIHELILPLFFGRFAHFGCELDSTTGNVVITPKAIRLHVPFVVNGPAFVTL